MAEQIKEKGTKMPSSFSKEKALVLMFGIAAVIVVGFFMFGQPTAYVTMPSETPSGNTGGTTGEKTTETSTTVLPSQFPVREKYFEEVFKPNRDGYKIFEKAAEHLGIPLSEVPAYFTLNSEEDIFANLPKPADDFSQIAYYLASGNFFALGQLDESYYMQPEFYPGFKSTGLKSWTEPNPDYWMPSGYGTYPAEQFDALSLSGRTEFSAVVFVYNGFGVQTYQGVALVPTSESLQYFDITISPDTFLLEPTFPNFHRNWAYKVLITGKVKPGTQPGEYSVGFLIVPPPHELREKWEAEHINLYYNAASAIRPSGYPVEFKITVEK